ncbi:MAG: NHLP family bacteriocin export ABC transporter peptidase/permease/ATPase subunit [Methylocystaceae bacterium]|nr:NHLP family bacteriocin export ABC transporter peptidase/permease/ATPase subunit [Methylocystaceae bacterium]
MNNPATGVKETPPDQRVKTPTILQMAAVECGAASLAMVLAHYGAWVPLEELRVTCGVTRDGSKASNLLKGARRYGLSAKGFKKEIKGLRDLPVPSILHWNFNHYVVFEGIKKDKVYINDPAKGPRTLHTTDLEASFTGVVLAFEPTQNFKKIGQPPGLFNAFSKLLAGSKSALAFITLASLALVIPGIAIAGFSKVFVDHILVAEKENWLVPLIIGIATAAFLRGMLTWLQQKYLLRMETKLALSMASVFLWRMLQLPISFFQQRHVGDLSDRMAANDRVATLLSGQLATNTMNLSSVIFYGAALAVFDVWLAVIAFILAFMNILALKVVDRQREDASRSLLVDSGKLAGATVSSIRSAETLKASGLENEAFAKWAGYQATMIDAQRKLGLSTAVLTAFPALMSSLTTAAILGVGGFRVMEGSLSIGAIVAIQSLMANFTKPIAALVDLGGQFQRIKGDLSRLDDVNAHPRETSHGPESTEGWQGPVVLSGKLEVEKLDYGYSPLDAPLLSDISLTLAPGARLALVGGSGSGKSTIGRLVAGVLTPWQGDIKIDGSLIHHIPRPVFASSVTYVDQDIFLFAGSIRDNLTLWNENIPDAALTRALKDACLHDDVMARTGQYDSLVEEGGINFSGGQRQRLEIARALVNDPTLLILDEATSALDPVTEKKIDDNLRRRGCACLIIAHRLSTIRDCDEIIVLKNGHIVERGTHDQLIIEDGEYKRLIGAESLAS